MTNLDLDNLKEFFRNRENIAAAFLFGSSQNGVVDDGSDVDIAILFNEKENIEYKFKLSADLSENVNVDDIDMITLNNADTILAFEAISGKLLCNNNIEKTVDFISYTSRVYEDVMANIEYQQSLSKKENI